MFWLTVTGGDSSTSGCSRTCRGIWENHAAVPEVIWRRATVTKHNPLLERVSAHITHSEMNMVENEHFNCWQVSWLHLALPWSPSRPGSGWDTAKGGCPWSKSLMGIQMCPIHTNIITLSVLCRISMQPCPRLKCTKTTLWLLERWECWCGKYATFVHKLASQAPALLKHYALSYVETV